MIICRLAPVCQEGKVLEQKLFIVCEVAGILGRGQLGLLGGELLVKVGDILQTILKIKHIF